ncbi:MAG: hypothetical protein LBK96_03485 [Prevotellaceae bacterium]|jgi:hypothetical protein|nr:hypothetical protein [Prevotellaceae bacterium]
MVIEDKIGIIMKAGGFAVLWVSIVTCTMFPDLLGNFNFLTERYSFGNIGQALLFALGVYTFDLMIQVLYAVDGHLSKMFIAQILGGVTVCVLAISFTKNMGVYNIWPILFVGLAMIYMKTITLCMSDKTKKIGNRKSIITIGGS